ncbi:hypothetical protein [Edaphobacter sp.]|uniref:hypothetical protein n=1 Tax=Edaphobacter sp. TaxID=1934404 RepID=UPI002DBA91A4|nr:hypothetical protein [Edaphobacter sp.]HEU5340871.1 hypothetical protein [Edaphobacter sp.]
MNLDYRASAFVVSVPHDEHNGCLHLVTAKHVAIRLQRGEAVIAFNGKDGLPLWMSNGDRVPWFFHPDETVDVAILPMASLRLNEYDYQDISTNLFLTSARSEEYEIGCGDDVFTIGLFTPFTGVLRFTPIVRTGVIAMMPDGRVHHPEFGSMEAYLTESRSLGGLSGSPVFVRDTVSVQGVNTEGKPRPFSAPAGFHLLGLLSGHWDAPGTTRHSAGLNMGISLVVPAAKILEALSSPSLTALREEAFQRGLIPEASNVGQSTQEISCDGEG